MSTLDNTYCLRCACTEPRRLPRRGGGRGSVTVSGVADAEGASGRNCRRAGLRQAGGPEAPHGPAPCPPGESSLNSWQKKASSTDVLEVVSRVAEWNEHPGTRTALRGGHGSTTLTTRLPYRADPARPACSHPTASGRPRHIDERPRRRKPTASEQLRAMGFVSLAGQRDPYWLPAGHRREDGGMPVRGGSGISPVRRRSGGGPS